MIRAVVSDFGGVVTLPLFEAFKRAHEEIGVPLLGSVPLQPGLAELADAGQPVLVARPESPAAISLREITERLRQKTAGRGVTLPILRN